MTPREFSNAVRGYNQESEQKSREAWEQARLMAYYSVAPHIKKGKTMRSLIPLPWDSEGMTDEARRAQSGDTRSKEEKLAGLKRLYKTIGKWPEDKPLEVC